MKVDERTTDYFFGGKIRLFQPKRGYRVSVDSCLLAYFVQQRVSAKRCVEFGTGSGIIGIALLKSEAVKAVRAIEVQESLAELALLNVRENELEKKMSVIEKDIRFLDHSDELEAEIVVMNPPFWAAGSGRHSDDEQKRIANHELKGNLDDWLAASKEILRNRRKSRIFAVYPAKKLNRIQSAVSKIHYNILAMSAVYPTSDSNAEWILIEAVKGHSENTAVLPPIILRDMEGNETETARRILNGEYSDALEALPDIRKRGSLA